MHKIKKIVAVFCVVFFGIAINQISFAADNKDKWEALKERAKTWKQKEEMEISRLKLMIESLDIFTIKNHEGKIETSESKEDIRAKLQHNSIMTENFKSLVDIFKKENSGTDEQSCIYPAMIVEYFELLIDSLELTKQHLEASLANVGSEKTDKKCVGCTKLMSGGAEDNELFSELLELKEINQELDKHTDSPQKSAYKIFLSQLDLDTISIKTLQNYLFDIDALKHMLKYQENLAASLSKLKEAYNSSDETMLKANDVIDKILATKIKIVKNAIERLEKPEDDNKEL